MGAGLVGPGPTTSHGLSSLQVTPQLASTTRESRTRAAWSVARRLDELLSAPHEAPPQFVRPARTNSPKPAAAKPGHVGMAVSRSAGQQLAKLRAQALDGIACQPV